LSRDNEITQLPRLQAMSARTPQAHGEVMTGEKMRFAIIESGGKQYRAVEGRTIEVDRLPIETGKKFDIERVLLMADDDNVMVGTPTVDGIEVKVTVADHIRGPKIDRFKYRPKKRIRVRGGHRQHYTLLKVDFIGKPGEERKVEEPVVEKQEAVVEVEAVVEAKPKAEKKPKVEKQAKAEKEAPAKKSATTAKKSTTTKTSSKKTEKK
jgi:large subunit ribosomal protein L21